MKNIRPNYDLQELHEEIAKDNEWRTNFRYLPTATKANLKFHVASRKKEDKQEKRLLIGIQKNASGARVYARVHRSSSSGQSNLVNLYFDDGYVVKLHQQQEENDLKLLREIEYHEPFNCLDKVGSGNWRKSLRFLVLYYFLEQNTPGLERLTLTIDGLELLKKACKIIAIEASMEQKKPARALLALPTTACDITKSESDRSGIEFDEELEKETLVKQELLVFLPLKAPENDSIRALDNMVHRHNNVSTKPLPKTKTYRQEPNVKHEPVPEMSEYASKPKRKRPASDEAAGEDEKEDPVLLCGRLKRVVRQEIEGLEETESALQDALNAQAMSLNEALQSRSDLEKALLDAEARVQTEQATKAATETKLNKVESELNDKRKLEKRVDSLYT
ncbi:uncharacterized protein J4E87_006063 [Alternaria ethzedia]|uniref:uncharacterized protein n=1 Tax=Alternaria ethzedia TaxID=181014 RepID=UPI0020C2CF25|nr:uncharacterized protein J4E87_006063 [Alternaria ethzedia]KAI4622970.1 hypothetical protein J4E87_006063 [Alternaria ethzedia]